jgi:polar amino acid transport system substrate-binding protein
VKALIAVAVAGVLAAAGTAAFARPEAAPPTKKPGVLTVGLNPPAVGFQVGTLRGSKVINPKGFEIDLAKAIGAKLGIARFSWINVPFTGLFRPGAKPFDFAFEEATITAQRKKSVDFSASYFAANQGVLIRKGITPPKSLDDLRKLQTCAQAVTTGLDYIQHRLHPQKQPLIYQTTAAAFTAVEVGRCDALVLDVPIVASQKKTKPNAYGPVAGQIVTREQYGAVLEKGSALKPQLDAAIKALTKNGTVGRLQKKWFNLNFAKVPVLR